MTFTLNSNISFPLQFFKHSMFKLLDSRGLILTNLISFLLIFNYVFANLK